MEILHPCCCGLDVHKETVVACVRLVTDGKLVKEVRTFSTTTASLGREVGARLMRRKRPRLEIAGAFWGRFVARAVEVRHTARARQRISAS